MTVMTTSPAVRVRDGWRSAHDAVDGVPRWARIAALAVPFTVLPAGLWRIAVFALHLPIIDGDGMGPGDAQGDLPGWMPMEAYVVVLSLVSELVAFTAVGLIARWGEVFPGWVPFLRGRRVPVMAAVIPASLGAAVLTVMWTLSVVNCLVFQKTIQGRPLPDGFPIHFHSWEGALGALAYAPLVAWGPLLAAVTVAYYRRRAVA
ncbi:hypothetical protein SAMN05443665_10525 [Actinomadura meyerae]|jgi:hypothetical protein|uniref:Uncharacterized protein n=1 Tax=Actinomadura meyerae TaxID=240840 RepID=A0A239NWG2_9ACTN|nr:hypothetical protein [Actinomadura meyerae]SNT59217.1 hypothetical protein SAMN05443665_10525 [Actinomadura meyerae]